VPFSNVYDPDDVITRDSIFGREWIITEKVDGSQTDIQFVDDAPDARNRNTDILHGGADRQYHPFLVWLQAHYVALWTLLGNDRILFGEWMFHVHSVGYTSLPDWYLAFDLFDKATDRFLPFEAAMASIEGAGLYHVPILARVTIRDQAHLLSFISGSAYGDVEMEGLVLHSADGQDHVKYVTSAFKDVVDGSRKWRWELTRRKNKLVSPPARLA
jgi:hypothetical protein